MKWIKNIALTFLGVFIICFKVSPQIKEITFGEIPREDIEMTEYSPDPSADAVILENYGQVTLSSISDLVVKFERHVRIKIINADGLDYANVELPFGSDDKIYGVKAASYNFEDGKIITSEVNRKSLYYEKVSRYTNTLRFSVPNVRVGSVIEFKYIYESPHYFTLYTLEFQYKIPVRKCNYRVEIPGYFQYKIIPSGDLKNISFVNDNRRVMFGHEFVEGFIGVWTGTNLPAYREEPFSTGSEDYYARIGFELGRIDIPGYYFENILPTYPKLSEKLLEESDFGGYFRNQAPIHKKVSELKAEGGSDTDILKRIYKFVTEYMMWNGNCDYTASATLNKVYNEARGNAADINLMLVAMIREAGLPADPVILSTRKNGAVNTIFAIIQKFNYVAVETKVDGNQYIIDATDPVRPFNMLPKQCLNGQGWVVTPYGGYWIDLTNGEHYSQSMKFDMVLDENGNLSGNAFNTYESYDAWAVRKICRLEGEEAYTDWTRYYYDNWKIEKLELDNIDQSEKPVEEKITLTVNDASDINGNLMYLYPVIYDRDDANEYYAEERISPIDLCCPSVEKYSCAITLPDGWTVAELPQSINILMEGGGAEFHYNIRTDGQKILVDLTTEYSTITYPPERYNNLRNFRASIIKKQTEAVILKKEI